LFGSKINHHQITHTMKTSVKLFLILMLLMTKATAQTPGWQWLSRVGGYSGNGNGGGGPDEWVKDIKTDAQGNVYVCGRVCYGANFNGDTMTTYQGYFSLFMAKLNCAGDLVWVKTAGTAAFNSMEAYGLALDNYGNIYLTGYLIAYPFNPTQLFDTLIAEDTNDFFLAKFDTSGNFKWAKIAGPGQGILGTRGFKIQITDDDMINVSGVGGSSGIFFPGYNFNYSWCFAARFDTSGNINRFQNLGSVYGPIMNDYKISPTGDQYITGFFNSDSMVIGDTTLYKITTVAGASDLFLTKFDSSGNFKWVKQISDSVPSGNQGYGISFDPPNILLVGAINASVTFDGFSFINNYDTSIYSNFPFIAKFNPSGNCIWATNSHHKYVTRATGGITTLSNGVSYYSGFFSGPAKFGTDSLSSNVLTDIFLAEVSPSGVITSGTKITSMGGGDEPQCMTHDSSGNVYIGGSYESILSINGVNYPFEGGNSDGFIAKWGTNCTVGIAEQEALLKENLFLFPNPATSEIKIQSKEQQIVTIEIFDMVSKKILHKQVSGKEPTVQIDVSSFSPGMYVVKANGKTNMLTAKFVKE